MARDVNLGADGLDPDERERVVLKLRLLRDRAKTGEVSDIEFLEQVEKLLPGFGGILAAAGGTGWRDMPVSELVRECTMMLFAERARQIGGQG